MTKRLKVKAQRHGALVRGKRREKEEEEEEGGEKEEEEGGGGRGRRERPEMRARSSGA